MENLGEALRQPQNSEGEVLYEVKGDLCEIRKSSELFEAAKEQSVRRLRKFGGQQQKHFFLSFSFLNFWTASLNFGLFSSCKNSVSHSSKEEGMNNQISEFVHT